MKGLLKYICLLFALANLITPAFAEGEETKIEDGIYSLDVVLWHAYEDKASMGASGIDNKANLYVKNGEMILYLGAKTLSVGNLTTSVDRFYYPVERENVYKLADTYVFEIEIKDEEKKRPRIFSFVVFSKDEFLNVMIDPKVEQMGNEPIKARLKIDWSSLKKIEQSGSLYDRAINDNTSDILQNEFKNQSIKLLLNEATKYQIGIISISRSVIDESNLNIDILDMAEGFEIVAKNEDIIPFDTSAKVKIVDVGKFKLEYTEDKFEVNEVIFLQGEEPKKLNFKKQQGKVIIDDAQQGKYIFVNRKNVVSTGDTDVSKSGEAAVSNEQIFALTKPKASKVKPINTKEIRNIINENQKNSSDNILESENKIATAEEKSSQPKQIVAPKKVENYGIIFVVAFVYLALLLAGLLIGAKFIPRLMDELERKRYIEEYSKGEKNEI